MNQTEAKKQRVGELKAEIENSLKGLDESAQTLIAQLPPIIDEWIDSAVKAQVNMNPDVVKELGVERIASLKKDIQIIKDELRETCTTDRPMPHDNKPLPPHKTHPNAIDPQRWDFKNKFFTRVFNNAAEPFGAFMSKSGLLKNRGNDWNSESKSPADFNEYRIDRVVAEAAEMQVYKEKWKNHYQLVDELVKEEKALNHLEANDLWSSS